MAARIVLQLTCWVGPRAYTDLGHIRSSQEVVAVWSRGWSYHLRPQVDGLRSLMDGW